MDFSLLAQLATLEAQVLEAMREGRSLDDQLLRLREEIIMETQVQARNLLAYVLALDPPADVTTTDEAVLVVARYVAGVASLDALRNAVIFLIQSLKNFDEPFDTQSDVSTVMPTIESEFAHAWLLSPVTGANETRVLYYVSSYALNNTLNEAINAAVATTAFYLREGGSLTPP